MLPRARELARKYGAQQLNNSALYWADKALSLSNGALEDLVVYIQSLFTCKEYRRAIHCLESSTTRTLLHRSSTLRYLAARCFAECEEWEEVITILATPKTDTSPLGQKRFSEEDGVKSHEVLSLGDLESASLVLRGAAHEGLGDLPSAMECYKKALVVDVFCEEALDKLCLYHFLSAKDEKQLLLSMPFKKQCSHPEEAALKALYQRKLSHTRASHLTQDVELPSCIESLQTNADVLSDVADYYLDAMNIDACYTHTSRILKLDPYHRHALHLHIVCCVCRSFVSELFTIGHQLVNTFPKSALAWYAVSCYYIALQKHQVARKYLSKSISLDANFAPAHMAFGISLASEGERDQARAAFAAAARIMQGSHLPLMFLGREYYLTCAMATSTKFMKNALSISPHNPILLQEVGVMLFNNGEYDKSESYLQLAVKHLRSIDPNVTLSEWEPVYNNLGHVMRKLGKYEESLQMHEFALQLCPNESTTLISIALTCLLSGNVDKVIKFTNQSLRLKREDQVALELLHTAIEESTMAMISESTPHGMECMTGKMLLKQQQLTLGVDGQH